MGTVIVYVHGLWQRGGEALWLRRRLARELAADVRTFSYPSVTADAGTNARQLHKFLTTLRADTVHLVGHSLGGLVILKAFEEPPALGVSSSSSSAAAAACVSPGRIVLLGSPVRGSRSAQNLARLPFGKKIMGRGVGEELLVARERRWNGARELGVIAGDLGVGLGRMVGRLEGASDGTILVEETQIEGAADRVVLRVSHTGMLFSASVARAAGVFLKSGRFGGR